MNGLGTKCIDELYSFREQQQQQQQQQFLMRDNCRY